MSTTYDLVGIGVGPFNLGLAALCNPLVENGELSAAFFEQRDSFAWHPGMMLEDATIQVPFMADLVTLADPTSRFSFLNYLKQRGRIHQFYIRESFYPLRSEYSDYCAWVAEQLETVHFSHRVTRVVKEGDLWRLQVGEQTVYARNVVMGVGTSPFVPQELSGALEHPHAWHSGDYLPHRDQLVEHDSVLIIGSGQSAAEIYRDLLPEMTHNNRKLSWVTRSERFFPMEYTKLTLEMTSPDYVEFFHGLDMDVRDRLNRSQRSLYKGISGDLVDEIYDLLYRLQLTGKLTTELRSDHAAQWLAYDGRHHLKLTHNITGATREVEADALVMATGYKGPRLPDFLEDAQGELRFDSVGRLSVGLDFSVDKHASFFVANAEEHTHALNAPDLGMGPWRNSIIIKQITGHEVYPIERNIAFQSFGSEA
ncbi:lysine N(6)-hydroxylase/L-ornithine N(5)-oxygenase family protein [Corynebacterium tapiri]|uniref:L-lysine N6-monooxygenase MbtG n=1 Tax=Corynebacterium tapiri TaxID=1448266 RepID=A0A5C4U5R0_9CORY|nr:SidA/IucD/PvdA family monooxygenase [Corynebacterium tapiri]TNL98547.1 L-lysine 6-monooxygenase [Corynebacterium tapiri]